MRFRRLEGRKRLILAEAVLFLFAVKILLLVLPLKTVLQVSLSPKKQKPGPNILNDIKWALLNADRLSFWKNRCLVECITGRWMLLRRGISSNLSFGVKFVENKKVSAHAWLIADDFEVVEKGGSYIELYKFQ